MDTRICMGESLCCSPEIITLLTGYTPIQNKKFKLWRKKSKKTEERKKDYVGSSVIGVAVIPLGRPHQFRGLLTNTAWGEL